LDAGFVIVVVPDVDDSVGIGFEADLHSRRRTCATRSPLALGCYSTEGSMNILSNMSRYGLRGYRITSRRSLPSGYLVGVLGTTDGGGRLLRV
jgi:hypothetical protein